MQSSILQKVAARVLKIAAAHQEQMSPWMSSVLFWIPGDVRIGLIKSSLETNYLKTCSANFPRAQSTSLLTPSWTLSRMLGVGSCSGSWFNPCGGGWQELVSSSQYFCVFSAYFHFSLKNSFQHFLPEGLAMMNPHDFFFFLCLGKSLFLLQMWRITSPENIFLAAIFFFRHFEYVISLSPGV